MPPIGESGPQGRAFVLTIPLNGCLPGKLLWSNRNCRCWVFENVFSFVAIVVSRSLIGDNYGVVKKGCSQSMRVPLRMLQRATKPFPLPGTTWVSNGGGLNSSVGSLSSTWWAVLIGVPDSSG